MDTRKIVCVGDIISYVDTWSERPIGTKGKYIRHGEVCEVYPYHVIVKTKCGYKVSVSKVDIQLMNTFAQAQEATI